MLQTAEKFLHLHNRKILFGAHRTLSEPSHVAHRNDIMIRRGVRTPP